MAISVPDTGGAMRTAAAFAAAALALAAVRLAGADAAHAPGMLASATAAPLIVLARAGLAALAVDVGLALSGQGSALAARFRAALWCDLLLTAGAALVLVAGRGAHYHPLSLGALAPDAMPGFLHLPMHLLGLPELIYVLALGLLATRMPPRPLGRAWPVASLSAAAGFLLPVAFLALLSL